MIRAAGILFLTAAGEALFLQRGPIGDHAGEWAFPGGKLEDGETAEQAAERETREEIGFLPEGSRALHTRRIATELGDESLPTDQVEFTTFQQRVPERFDPILNEEHVGFAWAPIGTPPEPLHPGVRIALARLTMDELGIARAMAAGELTSPQRYHNVTLYNLRITGTGVSYRPSLDEFVFRRPENYLTEDFLARCNGLPVIMVHPEKNLLNSEEYANRNVGSMFLPYIKDDDVWGIAKIYDDETIELLEKRQMSTSPAVLLGKSTKIKIDDGTEVLVEGNATLLDHLAIVSKGVWDKGGDPTGIEANIRKDAAVADENTKEMEEKAKADAAKARADAEVRMDEKLDMLLKGIDSVRSDMAACNSRMDAFEKEKETKADKARKDSEGEDPAKAERLAADKARKDAEDAKEKELEQARSDAADLKKQLADQAEQIKAIAAKIPRDVSDAEYGTLIGLQSRADDVYTAFGDRAPRPLHGETPLSYRRRLVSAMAKHSDRWKDIDLNILPETAFAVAEGQVYADAAVRARQPNDIAPGRIRERTREEHGHKITEFFGNDTHFVKQFARPARRVRGIRTGN